MSKKNSEAPKGKRPLPELTFQQFKEVLFKERPKFKSHTRKDLRKMHRKYLKDRIAYNRNIMEGL